MKKLVVMSILMMILSLILINSANAGFTVGMNMEADKKTIGVGDEEILTLSLNEKIIASNFEISYDSDAFTLIGSTITNLSVAEKNGKIACIYADISGSGTNKLSIKFKAKKESTLSKFGIENAKFRAEGQEKSYTGAQIQGIDKALEVSVVKASDMNKSDNENTEKSENILDGSLTKENENQILNKKDKTTDSKENEQDKTVVASSRLPYAGKGTGYILLIASIILLISSIIFGKKTKELDKIFSSISVIILAIFLVTSTTTKVSAANEMTIRYNDNLVAQKKILGIMLNNSEKKQITKSELLEKNTNITEIIEKGKEHNDLIKTGDTAKINDESYVIALYGDSNGDGIICDDDDIMVIIKDYLGTEKASEENMLTANLSNTDLVLDTDDLMQMIDMHLGTLKTTLVMELPENSIQIDNDIKVQYNEKSVGSFNTNFVYDDPPIFGSNSNGIRREGFFQANLAFSTNSNYEIQYEYVDNLSDLECLDRDNTFKNIELNKWNTYSSEISVVSKFSCQKLHNSSTFEKDFIKIRLYDAVTGKYSEEKNITIRQFFEGLGFTIMTAQ